MRRAVFVPGPTKRILTVHTVFARIRPPSGVEADSRMAWFRLRCGRAFHRRPARVPASDQRLTTRWSTRCNAGLHAVLDRCAGPGSRKWCGDVRTCRSNSNRIQRHDGDVRDAFGNREDHLICAARRFCNTDADRERDGRRNDRLHVAGRRNGRLYSDHQFRTNR